jgi:Abortive infection alpha
MNEAGDIIKSGAGEKIADLVNKLAGPLAEEVGMMFGDKVRVYGVKNWIKTVKKTARLLRDASLPANAVPPRLFLPIMEASSVEDNETLQDMWAGLLATASQDTDAVSPSFVETLRNL